MKLFGRIDGLSLIVVGFVALMCLPFFGVGLYEAYRSRQQLSGFRRAEGRVVDNSYATINDNGTITGAYHPVVEFRPAGGSPVRFTDGIGSLPPDYEVGAQVPVIYNPENHREARIYTWKRVWLAPTIFMAVGVLPVIVAIGAMRIVGRSMRPA